MSVQNVTSVQHTNFQGSKTTKAQETEKAPEQIKNGDEKLKKALVALGVIAAAGIGVAVAVKHHGKGIKAPSGKDAKAAADGVEGAAKAVKEGAEAVADGANKVVQEATQGAAKAADAAEESAEAAKKAAEKAKAVQQEAAKRIENQKTIEKARQIQDDLIQKQLHPTGITQQEVAEAFANDAKTSAKHL